MEKKDKTISELLEEQIKSVLEDIEMAKFSNDESAQRPLLEKLKTLCAQKLELDKLAANTEAKERELNLEKEKFEADLAARNKELELKEEQDKAKKKELELEQQKLETDAELKVAELKLKEEQDKKNHELEAKKAEMEAQKIQEQKRSNTTTAIIGGVTAITGILGLVATVICWRQGMHFEETGSFTSKTTQNVNAVANLFRKH